MDLKELLGEELYNQVVEKAGDKKLAVVNNGEWFPKEKFNEKNDEVKELKKQLKDRDEQLEGLKTKAAGHDNLIKEIDDLKKLNDDTKKDYEAKLTQQRKESKLELALKDAKAKNPKAVKALLDNDAIKLDGDKLLGLEEQLKALQESDAYLFDDGKPQVRGVTPNPNHEIPYNNGKNPWSKEHFNLTKQAEILRDNPDLAKQLQAQAK